MRLTTKQKKRIALLEQFIPSNIDWTHPHTKYNITELKLTEDKDGVEPEEAYFNWTDKGIKPDKIKNVIRYAQLVWGHKRLALHIDMWKQGMEDGDLFFVELDPEEAKLVRKAMGLKEGEFTRGQIEKMKAYEGWL